MHAHQRWVQRHLVKFSSHKFEINNYNVTDVKIVSFEISDIMVKAKKDKKKTCEELFCPNLMK